ncbi:Aste57867_21103 [Aphanomyces stellatus]|uniref:Aste57867_21103 protein n=1 Tax=Aphanomyces stellatus TaxID=120398 RepID=A0A485LHW7_9STRA|nr:hypothetical protein As57867_021035 [Aphanomyces stellatus]VFT97777.1 Aste57867_21103 [Aphanomyces stellatus]
MCSWIHLISFKAKGRPDISGYVGLEETADTEPVGGVSNDMAEPSPPENLIKFDAPIYTGEHSDGVKKTKPAPGTKIDPVSRIEDVLNAMLPPQTWKEETGHWMRYTSAEPSTRFDVIKLQELMDAKLIKRQARESGICHVREDIYSQCFDELIRQVTINSPERGLLLLRIRDEIRMTTDAYKTLYDSSITFGVRKQLQAEQGMGSIEDKIAVLTEEKREYENKVLELTNKLEVIEKRGSERRALQEKRYKEEIEFLKYQGQHLDAFLKSAGGAGK